MNPKSEIVSTLLRTFLILGLLAICAGLRLAPHPWNFTPIGAMAIFAGAMIRNRPWAFLFPLIAMFATDLLVGFNVLTPLVYISFGLSVLISRGLVSNSHASVGAQQAAPHLGTFVPSIALVGERLSASLSERSERVTNPSPSPWRNSIARIASATLLGSLQFFLVTNLGVWAFLGSYPRTGAGLVACYLAGIPLFLNTLAGDFTYTALLFGAFALAHAAVYPRLTASV